MTHSIKMLLVLIHATCFLSVAGASAQTCGLFVRVFQDNSENGTPVENARVRIARNKRITNATPIEAPSFDGFYLLKNLPSGVYELVVTKSGFRTSKQRLEIECTGGALQTEVEVFNGKSTQVSASYNKATEAVFSATN